MGRKDNVGMQSLFNMFADDDVLTLQTYISKFPLLSDGANTGGSVTIITGTGGTKVGTLEFKPIGEWAYNLHGLSFNANQNGTFGTNSVSAIRLNGVNLGSLGTVANFSTIYGDDLTLFGTLEIVFNINCGTGVVGTFTGDCEISGYKFKLLND